MKVKYMVGGFIAAVALGAGFMALDSSKIAYSDLSYAEQSGKRVQVKGVWVQDKPTEYDSHANVFSFTMKDTTAKQVHVIYAGARPNNFELAESIVVKGKVENGIMHADEILTKCPSKYESHADQLQEAGT